MSLTWHRDGFVRLKFPSGSLGRDPRLILGASFLEALGVADRFEVGEDDRTAFVPAHSSVVDLEAISRYAYYAGPRKHRAVYARAYDEALEAAGPRPVLFRQKMMSEGRIRTLHVKHEHPGWDSAPAVHTLDPGSLPIRRGTLSAGYLAADDYAAIRSAFARMQVGP